MGLEVEEERLMGIAPTGLLWVGPLYQTEGYGSISRNYLIGLHRIGFPVRAVNFGPPPNRRLPPNTLALLRQLRHADIGDAPIGVVNWSPDLYPMVKFRGVCKKVGLTLFETDRVPTAWVPWCREMDEIWVPTRFNFETFSQSGIPPEKLRVIPYGIDTRQFRPLAGRERRPGQKGFTFLYNFTLDWRKGFDLLLEAYFSEFTPADDVSLILKTCWVPHGGIVSTDVREVLLSSVSKKFRRPAETLPHWEVMDQRISEQELIQLYAASDLYTSTERACGWGFPVMEAMAMKVPVAGIDWGGSTEFLTPHNSLLIPTTGRMVPVDDRLAEARRTLYAGHQWAEVTVEAVRKVMRYAYEHPRELKALAERALRDIEEYYPTEVAARHLANAVGAMKVEPLPQRFWRRTAGVTVGRSKFHPLVFPGIIKRKLMERFSGDLE